MVLFILRDFFNEFFFPLLLILALIIKSLHVGAFNGRSTKCVSIIKEQVLPSCQQDLYFFLKKEKNILMLHT